MKSSYVNANLDNMNRITVFLLAGCLVLCQFGSVELFAKPKMLLQRLAIRVTDTSAPGMGQKIGKIEVFDDYSFKVDCSDKVLAKKIAKAFREIVRSGEAVLSYENMDGGATVMYSKTVKRRDKDFIYGLIEESKTMINRDTRGVIVNFDYR